MKQMSKPDQLTFMIFGRSEPATHDYPQPVCFLAETYIKGLSTTNQLWQRLLPLQADVHHPALTKPHI